MGELTALPDPLAGFKGPTSKGREGKEWREGRYGQGRNGKGEEEERSGSSKFATTPLVTLYHALHTKNPKSFTKAMCNRSKDNASKIMATISLHTVKTSTQMKQVIETPEIHPTKQKI